jgi:hypothetical protein
MAERPVVAVGDEEKREANVTAGGTATFASPCFGEVDPARKLPGVAWRRAESG